MITPWHLPTGQCPHWSAQRLVTELLASVDGLRFVVTSPKEEAIPDRQGHPDSRLRQHRAGGH
jgi:hypothetical protein